MAQEGRKGETLRIAQAYRNTFTSPEGRIVMKDLLRTARIFAPTGVMDDAALRQLEGERNAIKRIIAMSRLTEAQLLNMAEEKVSD